VSARLRDAAAPVFSLVEDPLLRLQRALRLAPPHGFGAVRRALIVVAITWVPIMVWAAMSGYLGADPRDPVLRHLGVHVRCLLAIPLMILSEPLANWVMGAIVGNFVPSGLVRSEDHDRFHAVLESVERWRDSKWIWIGMVGLVVLNAWLTNRVWINGDTDALTWAEGATTLDFGGAWGLFVVRPLFLFLLLVWVWRLMLTWILFRRISRLELQLVPSHPDRVGGLGFLEFHSAAFGLIVLAVSSVFSAAVAHQILNHDATLKQFQIPLLVLLGLIVVLFLLPLTSFQSRLRRANLRARFEYGTLAGRHVRGLHERWVEGKKIEDDILSAPEIGPAADVATLYGMGTSMKFAPIGKVQIGTIIVPALLPLIFLIAIEVPITEVLLKLLQTLT